MKVICDNCRAVYKIPDEKLAKPVNKATCRKCGHRMLIPRPRQGQNPDEKTLVTAVPPTPPPAPSRESSGYAPRDPSLTRPPPQDPQTMPIAEEEPEATMPGLTPQNGYGSGAYALSSKAPPASTGVHQLNSRVPTPTLSPPSDDLGGDDVPLYTATPMPPPDRESRPDPRSEARAPGRTMPAPPAPLLQNATPPAAPPRPISPRTPAPQPPRSAARTPTAPSGASSAPNTLGTGGDWKPSEAILASINPNQNDPTTRPNGSVPAPAPLPRPKGQTPAPAPLRNVATSPSVISVYDPANDLTLAMVASLGSMIGTFILVLALLTVPNVPLATVVLVAIGMVLAFIGSVTAVLVIFTGGRGRRPARPLLSVVMALGCSLIVTAFGTTTLLVRDRIIAMRELGPSIAASPAPPRDDASVLAAAHPPRVAMDAAATEAAPVEDAPATTSAPAARTNPSSPRGTGSSGSSSSSGSSASSGPVAETFAPRNPRPGGSTTTTTSVYTEVPTSSGSTGSTSSGSSSDEDEFAFLDEPSPRPTGSGSTSSSSASTSSSSSGSASTPKPGTPETVSDTVIDTILRNDIGIKKCFFNHQRATGSLPERVVVTFKISPAGVISGGGVSDAEFKGTDLDVCLGKALAAVVMPPSVNGRATLKYPFQLQ